MAVDIEKICRTCLALSGPLLSIYDGDTYGGTIADMLTNFTKMKPSITDNMPQKVCLVCISEINRCYSFKMKCENSNRTLRQLLPDAKPETEEDDSKSKSKKDSNVSLRSISIQTSPERQIPKQSVCVQTSPKQSRIHNQDSAKDLPKEIVNEVLNGSVALSQARKRKSTLLDAMQSPKKNVKKQITESYKIDCDEDEGYDFILKLDADLQKDLAVESSSSGDTQKVVVNSTNSAASYKIAEKNFDCDEYEIEAYVEEDPTVESDGVLVVKAESICSDENSQKSFVIVNGPKSYGRSIKEYGCVECVMSFYSLKVLRRHMSKHHGRNVDEINLNDMNYRVIDKSKLYNSVEDRHNGGTDTPPPIQEDEMVKCTSSNSETELNKDSKLKFVCTKCKSIFTSQRALNYHKRKNICNAKGYECDQCERVFTSAAHLDSHKELHKNVVIECAECGKSFSSNEELSNHQISVHNRNARNQCNICKKVFTMLSTLRDHLRTHSGERPFLCTICGKSFTQSANLKQHIQRHDNNKKFKCDECPNSYVTKAELFSHKRSHTGDHPFKCEECSATFTTSSSLVKHRRRHTGERPYSCDICPMRFAVQNVLKNHRRLHTGEKPYKCPHCDKRFTQRGDCVIHASKHVKENEVFCKCGKSFPHAALLRHHTRRYHPHLYVEKGEDESNAEISEENIENKLQSECYEAGNMNDLDLATS